MATFGSKNDVRDVRKIHRGGLQPPQFGGRGLKVWKLFAKITKHFLTSSLSYQISNTKVVLAQQENDNKNFLPLPIYQKGESVALSIKVLVSQ